MAIVMNRTTLQIINSANTPDYPVEDWIINPDLSDVSGIDEKYWKIVGDTVVEMNQSEKDVVDAADFVIAKATRRNLIDYQSGVLIAGGFTYDSTQFSLSANAQINWTNVHQNRANWSYPLKVSIFALSGEYSLTNQTTVENFYNTGIQRVKTILDGGRQLKIDINNAADQTELDAVVDDRT